MSVASKASLPSVITAGDTIIFSVGPDARYPNTGWTLKFILSRDGQLLKSWDAASATDGLGFVVTLPASDTAQIVPGRANPAFVFTETDSSQRETISWSDTITILPDPTQILPDSDNRKALKAANAAIAQIAAAPYSSVSFNGQSYSIQNLKDLLALRDRLAVVVAAEFAELGIGPVRGGFRIIQTRFR